MGDILASIIWVIVIGTITAVYLKFRKEKSGAGLYVLWLGVASMWGGFLMFMNDVPVESKITFLKMGFFSIQCFSSLIYFIKPRAGILLLMLTLFVQIPILDTQNFTYRNQTLMSMNFRNYPSKIMDVEPGSYIIYFEHKNQDKRKQTSSGINLIPCLIIILLFRHIKTKTTISEDKTLERNYY